MVDTLKVSVSMKTQQIFTYKCHQETLQQQIFEYNQQLKVLIEEVSYQQQLIAQIEEPRPCPSAALPGQCD